MWYQLRDIPHSRYVALDASKQMLLRHPRGAKHVVANLEQALPLEDASFDVAVSFFTLEHLHQVETFFAESFRILRKEGILFVGNFLQRRMFERNLHHRRFKIQQYPRSAEELSKEAENAGFQVGISPLFDKNLRTGDLLICQKLSA